MVVVGSSGHANAVLGVITLLKRYEVVGLVDPTKKSGDQVAGHPILGSERDLPSLRKKYNFSQVVVAIGDNAVRSNVVSKIKEVCPDLKFASVVHPNSNVASTVVLGEGTHVLAGVSINANCTIGDFCILNTNSSLDHDSILGDFSSIGPGATIGGHCRVGQYSAIGIGAVLVHKTVIGDDTVIGAGSTVLHSVKSQVIAYGTPAKIVRERRRGEQYL